MEEMEMDVVVFEDEEGNELELNVVDYFDYEGDQYAVMIDPSTEMDDEEEEKEEEEEEYVQELYIFRIEDKDGEQEFVPADDDKMDALTEIVEKRLAESDCDCGGEGCENCTCEE